jgi:hypothetical protein
MFRAMRVPALVARQVKERRSTVTGISASKNSHPGDGARDLVENLARAAPAQNLTRNATCSTREGSPTPVALELLGR